MTTEMMMIMRFIERNMEEHMSMAVAMYGQGDYVYGHTYIERVCTYGNARKILLNGGTKEDIQKLADEYFDTGKSHIWFTYNEVAKEISSIEQFVKCGLYKTNNAEQEAENRRWIFVDERLPEDEQSTVELEQKSCKTCHLWEDGELSIDCPWGSNYDHYEYDYCSLWEKQY